ncbi:MAG: error-prone DNA polymerase, partial [Pseudomonadota bacterium]
RVAERARAVGLFAAHFAVGEMTAKTPEILAWRVDRAGFGRFCRFITIGNMRGEKADCRLTLGDLKAWCEGLILAPLPATASAAELDGAVEALRPHVTHPMRIALTKGYGTHDERTFLAHARHAVRLGLKPLATNLPLYHAPDRRPLQDVLTAIRTHTTVETAGTILEANAERHLKPPAEMARLFGAIPEAVAETLNLWRSIEFSLDELRYEYPEEPTDPGATPQQTLVRLTRNGAAKRYPHGLPERVRAALEHELDLIGELEYAPYFLTVYDVVRFARDRGILAQGRGSAANSAVCFCLGITEVDPVRGDLLFERFISPERKEPPDIDVDFEHERREEVIQYIYDRYGRERAGIAATVITYRARSAAREVGKALGLSEDTVATLSGTIWGWSTNGVAPQDVARAGLDPGDHRVGHLIAMTHEIGGFPRHLSQHVGGFVITRGRLDELVPITKAAMEGRTNIEWDKDDLDALGILKIDVLALGMLTCIRKGLTLLADHYADDFHGETAEATLAAPFSAVGDWHTTAT